MGCTTILVGKKASYDGSTMIARNDDGHFDVKKLVIVKPHEQVKEYHSVISHLVINLPDNPYSYTMMPNVDKTYGLWAASGINSMNVSMTATETITTNARVLGADPLIRYLKKTEQQEEVIGGLGEEDLVVVTLPYISSAREGVIRLGSLLEKYGTYETNGIAFSDKDEIWWLETIGGHNWIARRVKDDEYVLMPNQFGLDRFDFDDALTEKKENMCSTNLKKLVDDYHLDLNMDTSFNPRLAFGSHDDSDHVYNTPRGWYMARYFNPHTYKWDGDNADYTPESDDIPWSLVPERKITIEDVKYILSSYYQGTPYNPYSKIDSPVKGKYRPIGISRTGFMAINQIRGYLPKDLQAIEWICFGSNPFNVMVPFYTNTLEVPKYLGNVTLDITTDNLYWNSRLLAALTDAHFSSSIIFVERYQKMVAGKSHELINKYDKLYLAKKEQTIIDEANMALAEMVKKETADVLNKVLYDASSHMKNDYKRSDN